MNPLITAYFQRGTVDETDTCTVAHARFKKEGKNNKRALLQYYKTIVTYNIRKQIHYINANSLIVIVLKCSMITLMEAGLDSYCLRIG